MKETNQGERQRKPYVDKVNRNKIHKFSDDHRPGPQGNDNTKPFRKPKNEIKLNKFHQIQSSKKKKRSLKKQIEGVEHLLKRDDIDESVKTEKAQMLEDLKKQVAEKQKKKSLILKNEAKYKKVRFFEQQKVRRMLKKANKQAEKNPDDPEINETIEDLKKKLSYIKNFPMDKKYISLFPSNKQENETTDTKRSEIMHQIDDKMQKRREYTKKLLERIPAEREEDNLKKMDNFFEEEEPTAVVETVQKKMVDKKGRIISEPKNF